MATKVGKMFNRNILMAKGSFIYKNSVKVTHDIIAGANYTTAGGAAAEAITVTGITTSDIPFVTLQDNGTNNVTIISAVITAGVLTITFSGDPAADTIVSYQIIRAGE